MIPLQPLTRKGVLSILLVIFSISTLKAQQGLLPLEGNAEIFHTYQVAVSNAKTKSGKDTVVDTLQINLPDNRVIFRDDFSSYAGWPHHELWVDRQAYINSTFGLNPYSIGVATFDGLDEKGYPLQFCEPIFLRKE